MKSSLNLVMPPCFCILIIVSFSLYIIVNEENNVRKIQKMLSGLPLYIIPELLLLYVIFIYSPISIYFTCCIFKVLNIVTLSVTYSIFKMCRILSLFINLLIIIKPTKLMIDIYLTNQSTYFNKQNQNLCLSLTKSHC